MDTPEIERLTARFLDYADSFHRGGGFASHGITLKIGHTLRVLAEVRRLAAALGMEGRPRLAAECAALFHDFGRFEQLRTHGTLLDARSMDHGDLGASLLLSNRVLETELDEREAEDVRWAVSQHNKREVSPSPPTPFAAHLCRMVRDCDKLDIWHILLDTYETRSPEGRAVVLHGLPDTPGLSDELFQAVAASQVADRRHVRNLNDYKLLQMGWVFDLNFSWSLRQVASRRIVERLAAHMPAGDPRVERISAMAADHLALGRPLGGQEASHSSSTT